MRIVVIISRVMLGLLFIIMGVNGFTMFMRPPAVVPHNVGLWDDAMFGSHFIWFTSGIQVLCGVLLLVNRFVPLALVILAAVLANILVFHLTMWPDTIFPGILALALWLVVAWPLRDHFAPLFTSKVEAR